MAGEALGEGAGTEPERPDKKGQPRMSPPLFDRLLRSSEDCVFFIPFIFCVLYEKPNAREKIKKKRYGTNTARKIRWANFFLTTADQDTPKYSPNNVTRAKSKITRAAPSFFGSICGDVAKSAGLARKKPRVKPSPASPSCLTVRHEGIPTEREPEQEWRHRQLLRTERIREKRSRRQATSQVLCGTPEKKQRFPSLLPSGALCVVIHLSTHRIVHRQPGSFGVAKLGLSVVLQYPTTASPNVLKTNRTPNK
jgi:hypothetical protein